MLIFDIYFCLTFIQFLIISMEGKKKGPQKYEKKEDFTANNEPHFLTFIVTEYEADVLISSK